MKKILPLLLAVATLTTLPSCRFISVSDEFNEALLNSGFDMSGNGAGERITASDNYITREAMAGDFHSLTCNLPGDVIYTPGDCAVSIYAPDNVMERISVSNENGTLVIKSNLNRIRNLKKITVNISSPVLESVNFNGAVDFNAPDGITALNFDATVNGAGDIDINGLQANEAEITVNGAGDAKIEGIDCDALLISINGAGDASLSGKAGRADLSISGAGDIDARELNCTDINSKIRGMGSIKRPKE
jgi:hypothetical protein